MITDVAIGNVVFAHHSLILTAAMTNIGVQSVLFWAFARIVGEHAGLLPVEPAFNAFRRLFTSNACCRSASRLSCSGSRPLFTR